MNENADQIRIDPLVQAAFMAGRGHSAEEIAAALSLDDVEAVMKVLRLYNVRADRRGFHGRLYGVRVADAHMARIKAAADARAIEPAEAMRRLLAFVGMGQVSIDAIFDDGVTTPR